MFVTKMGLGPPPFLGDVDANGIVNFADFQPIRANFRKTVLPAPKATSCETASSISRTFINGKRPF